MAYQTPITVEKALDRIQRHEYVIPAIQREFVWDLDQVCRLFDSLLCGYPIGTFLFWRIQPEELEARRYSFYDVVREYHDVKNHHNQPLDLPNDRDVVAILDGQQRLTSLNLGLRGSYTTKRRSGRGSSELYETRRLHLDLLHDSSTPDDNDSRFRFRFLTQDEVHRDNEAAIDVGFRHPRRSGTKAATSSTLCRSTVSPIPAPHTIHSTT